MSAITHFIQKGVRQSQIDEYLGSELGRAGYGGVEIAKTPLGERITIHAARPGIVIGRRGKNIRMITDELVARFGLENPQIEVKEVSNPELNSKVMAYSLVSAIERGVHRRRAAYSVLRRVVNAGAKGCEILISGKLTSKRSRHEAYRMGLVAKSGELGSTYVMRANATAVMKLGTIGVTVNIMRGDVQLPDEISILAVKFVDGKIVDETSPEAVEVSSPKDAPKKKETKDAVTPKTKEAPAKKEEAPKKKEAKVDAKKKTDLDREVEELSDLIEKSPGEETKPKKTEKKKAPVKKAEKKPAEKKPKAKTTKKDEAKPKAKITKKDEAKPKAKTSKKDEAKPKAKTSKKDEAKPKAKTSKKDEAKPKAKITKKDEAKSKTKDTKAKSSKKDDKDKKSKSKKEAKKK